uniref:Uncharacterized protein n=1 Tax=Chromera velia CCMP2878 TaxID=1169474 RepID=A0A0G4I534_9ALVE|eukprot:Cvel_11037.t1-p1 / transcript=Cvel_11037.t1 / gene=Cvel_11037 / organism=Chromera_velia_CCMP2878 / gene_product=hypothetical protein / transcript_product=hypothetical protein / location=Cvel_scaffold680:61325-69603(+) / protein_length=1301 / sequence_SO=supercontig / SO=protein_coding / is_pseudo=false
MTKGDTVIAIDTEYTCNETTSNSTAFLPGMSTHPATTGASSGSTTASFTFGDPSDIGRYRLCYCASGNGCGSLPSSSSSLSPWTVDVGYVQVNGPYNDYLQMCIYNYACQIRLSGTGIESGSQLALYSDGCNSGSLSGFGTNPATGNSYGEYDFGMVTATSGTYTMCWCDNDFSCGQNSTWYAAGTVHVFRYPRPNVPTVYLNYMSTLSLRFTGLYDDLVQSSVTTCVIPSLGKWEIGVWEIAQTDDFSTFISEKLSEAAVRRRLLSPSDSEFEDSSWKWEGGSRKLQSITESPRLSGTTLTTSNGWNQMYVYTAEDYEVAQANNMTTSVSATPNLTDLYQEINVTGLTPFSWYVVRLRASDTTGSAVSGQEVYEMGTSLMAAIMLVFFLIILTFTLTLYAIAKDATGQVYDAFKADPRKTQAKRQVVGTDATGRQKMKTIAERVGVGKQDPDVLLPAAIRFLNWALCGFLLRCQIVSLLPFFIKPNNSPATGWLAYSLRWANFQWGLFEYNRTTAQTEMPLRFAYTKERFQIDLTTGTVETIWAETNPAIFPYSAYWMMNCFYMFLVCGVVAVLCGSALGFVRRLHKRPRENERKPSANTTALGTKKEDNPNKHLSVVNGKTSTAPVYISAPKSRKTKAWAAMRIHERMLLVIADWAQFSIPVRIATVFYLPICMSNNLMLINMQVKGMHIVFHGFNNLLAMFSLLAVVYLPVALAAFLKKMAVSGVNLSTGSLDCFLGSAASIYRLNRVLWIALPLYLQFFLAFLCVFLPESPPFVSFLALVANSGFLVLYLLSEPALCFTIQVVNVIDNGLFVLTCIFAFIFEQAAADWVTDLCIFSMGWAMVIFWLLVVVLAVACWAGTLFGSQVTRKMQAVFDDFDNKPLLGVDRKIEAKIEERRKARQSRILDMEPEDEDDSRHYSSPLPYEREKKVKIDVTPVANSPTQAPFSPQQGTNQSYPAGALASGTIAQMNPTGPHWPSAAAETQPSVWQPMHPPEGTLYPPYPSQRPRPNDGLDNWERQHAAALAAAKGQQSPSPAGFNLFSTEPLGDTSGGHQMQPAPQFFPNQMGGPMGPGPSPYQHMGPGTEGPAPATAFGYGAPYQGRGGPFHLPGPQAAAGPPVAVSRDPLGVSGASSRSHSPMHPAASSAAILPFPEVMEETETEGFKGPSRDLTGTPTARTQMHTPRPPGWGGNPGMGGHLGAAEGASLASPPPPAASSSQHLTPSCRFHSLPQQSAAPFHSPSVRPPFGTPGGTSPGFTAGPEATAAPNEAFTGARLPSPPKDRYHDQSRPSPVQDYRFH